jgi:7-carboxy-7-deazaguanine synthase
MTLMNKYRVAEHFASINGEGRRAGQLAYFIRFQGCNLSCSYCDTSWANGSEAPYTEMSAGEIFEIIINSGIHNVTLTGGEPLLREGMEELITLLLSAKHINVEIETNGSIPLKGNHSERLSFTMDYKLPSSGMEEAMLTENFDCLNENDTVKFVAGTAADLERMLEIINTYALIGRCGVYVSPVYGKIELTDIVDFMKINNLNGVNMQLQLHKIIWDPEKRGV